MMIEVQKQLRNAIPSNMVLEIGGPPLVSADIKVGMALRIGTKYKINSGYGNGGSSIPLGKNLFNKDDDTNKIEGFINGSTKKLIKYNATKSAYVNILPNTIYTVSKTKGTRFIIGTSSSLDFNTTFTNIKDGNNDPKKELTITSGSNDKYLVVFYYNSGSDTLSAEEIANTIQIEKGSIATDYEPFIGL